MTLRGKMALQIGAMLCAIGLLAGASIWGLLGLQRDLGSALTGYDELRQLYEVGSHIRTAQALLALEQPDRHQAMREIQHGSTILTMSQHKIRHKDELQASLREAQQQLWPAIVDNQSAANASALLDKPLRQIANLDTDIHQRIREKEDAAARKRHTTLMLMSLISGLTIAGAIIVGFLHYRSVATPLRKLQTSVRILAEGKFSERVPPLTPAEFTSLASDFNRMATELDTLYRQLEEKVAAKSKELVRSERLASVGYLAAGVAHEINNPMGIIAGYAELSLQALKQKAPPEAIAEAEKSMKVISEEAFRCKEIVEKLLSLARSGDENRKIISLKDVAANVVNLVTGLGEHKDRKITLHSPDHDPFNILASENEMKQVLLNLTLNALQSLNGSTGQVSIDLIRDKSTIQLSVTDNGRGMSADVLDHIFEPFFTAKRGAGPPGTGLGLSISHMIVQNHGGRITATSPGPNKGSTFTLHLPAA
ncbi:MAG TPA: HAMP domain-containing sensor histidine kinase [Tepidisphaeraceae bacterium]|nr:HAMP domain-containing sensor histidine kinase [Tepidisphaeraceae bacterium]